VCDISSESVSVKCDHVEIGVYRSMLIEKLGSSELISSILHVTHTLCGIHIGPIVLQSCFYGPFFNIVDLRCTGLAIN